MAPATTHPPVLMLADGRSSSRESPFSVVLLLLHDLSSLTARQRLPCGLMPSQAPCRAFPVSGEETSFSDHHTDVTIQQSSSCPLTTEVSELLDRDITPEDYEMPDAQDESFVKRCTLGARLLQLDEALERPLPAKESWKLNGGRAACSRWPIWSPSRREIAASGNNGGAQLNYSDRTLTQCLD